MVNPEAKLFCRLDRVKPIAKEERRIKAIANLALLDTQVASIFEQATQSAARFLDFPVSYVGLMGQDAVTFKSLVSSRTAPLIQQLRSLKQIPASEAFCAYVVDSENVVAIADVAASELFSQSILFQHYSIAAYLGVPLLTSDGDCLGTIAVADFIPRTLTDKDIEFLSLLSNWMMSEIQRCQLELKLESAPIKSVFGDDSDCQIHSSTQDLKVELLNHLCQDLLTPLTSIKGMTSVLSREIYGALNHKQKEYLEVINCSGKYMLSLVEEILALDILDENSQKLYLSSVDLEMVGQQAIASVDYVAARYQQKLKLSVPQESRIWLLDKDKVRQMLYYLLFSLLQTIESGSLFEIVVGQYHHKLAIAIGVVLPERHQQMPVPLIPAVNSLGSSGVTIDEIEASETNLAAKLDGLLAEASFAQAVNSISLANFVAEVENKERSNPSSHSRESLGLLLSYRLAELHGGQISLHQLPDYGCCYLITLPQLIKAAK